MGDICMHDINFTWKKEGSDDLVTSAVFPKGNSVPSIKMLTFLRNESFSLEASYGETAALPEGMGRVIGQYEVGPLKPPKGGEGKTKLKVQVRLNLHGIVEVESVHSIEEEDEVEVLPEKPASKPQESAENKEDEEMKDANGNESEGEEENGEPKAEPEAEAAPEPKKELRKRTLKIDVPFKSKTLRLSPAEVKDFASKENAMIQADILEELTKEARNNMEGYILSARGKLYDVWNDYVTEDDRSKLSKILDET